MISAKTFSPKIKSMTSSFLKNIYNFDIFYHFPQFEQSKSEVWKGKNLCARGVNLKTQTANTIVKNKVTPILFIIEVY